MSGILMPLDVEVELSPLELHSMQTQKELAEKQKVTELPGYKCKVASHNKEDLCFVCTYPNCENVLLCKKCCKTHKQIHGQAGGQCIRPLNDWFNGMFGRKVEDSRNNKVSRKCGMNLGRLNEELKTFKETVAQRKLMLQESIDRFMEELNQILKTKSAEQFEKMDKLYDLKSSQLEEQSKTYKKLKSANRFTILENLKRQHDPNGESPPTIPIDSIVRFLIASEKQFIDKTQIEEQHKSLSKLLRDTESLLGQVTNDSKSLKKIPCEQDTVLQGRIFEDVEGLLFGMKKRHYVSRDDGDYLVYDGDGLNKHIVEEESEYECIGQENFNSAQFIDFQDNHVRVFADQKITLYAMNNNEQDFQKEQSLIGSQQIVAAEQEMYEIGAMEEVYGFFKKQDMVLQGKLKDEEVKGQQGVGLQVGSQNRLPLLILGLKADPARIEVWDVNINTKVCEYPAAHECSITCIQILDVIPGESVIFAVGSYDGLIKTWVLQCKGKDNQQSEEYTLSQQLQLKGHSDFITTMITTKLNQYPKCTSVLVSTGSDKKIIFWDWKYDQQSQLQSQSQVQQAQPQSSPVLLGLSQKENLEGISLNSSISEKDNLEEQKKQVKKAPFLKKQFKLSSTSTLKSLVSPNQHQYQPVSSSSQNLCHIRDPQKIIISLHKDKINCLELLEEGYLASGSSDGTIKIWDMDNSSEQKELQNKYIVNSVGRLKRGQLVCSGNNVKMNIYQLNIWNWELGQIIQVIKGHAGRISQVHVISPENPMNYQNSHYGSPNNEYLPVIVSCERNKVIRLWRQQISQIVHDSTSDNIVCSPTASLMLVSSLSARRTSFPSCANPAEEFFHNYHIELDPSLTPKCVNLQGNHNNRQGNLNNNSSNSSHYEKTPVSGNILRQPLLFSSYLTQPMSPNSPVFPNLGGNNNLLDSANGLNSIAFKSQQSNGNNINATTRSVGNNGGLNERDIHHQFAQQQLLMNLNSQLAAQAFSQRPKQRNSRDHVELTPLAEANNESGQNSPVETLNPQAADKQQYSLSSFAAYNRNDNINSNGTLDQQDDHEEENYASSKHVSYDKHDDNDNDSNNEILSETSIEYVNKNYSSQNNSCSSNNSINSKETSPKSLPLRPPLIKFPRYLSTPSSLSEINNYHIDHNSDDDNDIKEKEQIIPNNTKNSLNKKVIQDSFSNMGAKQNGYHKAEITKDPSEIVKQQQASVSLSAPTSPIVNEILIQPKPPRPTLQKTQKAARNVFIN